MRFGPLQRLLVCGVLGAAAAACGTSGTPEVSCPGCPASLQQLQSAIEASTGHSPASVEILLSPVHMHIMLTDDKLARSDGVTREHVVLAVVAAVEQAMASDTRLNSIEEVSVAIIHPERAQGLLWSSHTEDVLYFRKGSDRRFQRDAG